MLNLKHLQQTTAATAATSCLFHHREQPLARCTPRHLPRTTAAEVALVHWGACWQQIKSEGNAAVGVEIKASQDLDLNFLKRRRVAAVDRRAGDCYQKRGVSVPRWCKGLRHLQLQTLDGVPNAKGGIQSSPEGI
jgi:hypothetical protein